jgi:hypothetical protein
MYYPNKPKALQEEKRGGGDKEGMIPREIKTQPTVAQKRSQRIANQGIQGASIQGQATKLKALRNESTCKPQFTVFNS